jgi:hypothetical protein
MEIILWIILGIVIGIYLGNSNFRYNVNDGIINLVHHYKPQRSKPKKPRARRFIEDEENESGENIKQPPIKGKLCGKCGEPVESIDKMPGYFFCHKCESIVSAKGI